MNLHGRVALVTGGAVRIGRTIALALANEGADVVITYRTSRRDAQDALKQLRASHVQAEAFRTDLTQASQVRSLMQNIQRRFRRLDVLVNNAAVFVRTPWSTLTERNWDFHLDTNLKGPFLCALYASRLMRKHGEGKIINLADWAGERPYRDYLPYCVSKAGVIGMTKALAKELAPSIQVVAIAPGPILPPPGFTRAQQRRVLARVPLQRWGSPTDLANTVVFAIQGTNFMTGSTLFVDGGQLIA